MNCRGHLTCARLLIRHGARLDAFDEGGNTPLHAAVLAGHYECAQELVHYGADVNLVNRDNGTALHYASSVPIVTLLLENGADPDIAMTEVGGKGEEKSAFHLFLETMPEACNEILSKYLTSNGKSLGAVELEIAFNYELFLEVSYGSLFPYVYRSILCLNSRSLRDTRPEARSAFSPTSATWTSERS